jgi:carbonic anhydrase
MKGRLLPIILGLIILVVGGLGALLGARLTGNKADAKQAHASGKGHSKKADHQGSSHEEKDGAAHDEDHHASSDEEGHEDNPSPAEVWETLLEGNARFVAGEREDRDLVARRDELAESQHPNTIVLTCSDSRVSPELLFDQGLGDLFVIRTAGNIADRVGLGSIEYAVEHLHSHLIVVLGHEKCGAVAAAASRKPMPTANLTAIVRRISPALAKAGSATDPDERARKQVIANVRQSARDLVRHSPILAKEVRAKKVQIIKAIYSLESGEVERL